MPFYISKEGLSPMPQEGGSASGSFAPLNSTGEIILDNTSKPTIQTFTAGDPRTGLGHIREYDGTLGTLVSIHSVKGTQISEEPLQLPGGEKIQWKAATGSTPLIRRRKLIPTPYR